MTNPTARASIETVQDLRYGLRMLGRHPSVAGAAILTLALGFGVNTAVFSVVNAVLLRPLPVRDGARLVVLASQPASSRTLQGVSLPDIQDLGAATDELFEDIAGYSVGFLGLAAPGWRPERVLVTWATDNYFTALDVNPLLGRALRTGDGASGRTDPVVVLGYSTWQRRFGGDRSVIGQRVLVNGRPCTVVGVAPRGFAGTFAFSDSELYLPLHGPGGGPFESRRARGLHAIARLRPGVGIEHAQAAVSAVAERLARQHPDSNANLAFRVLPERLARPEEDQFRTNALGAAIVLGMVVLVLIVAAVNVTNLLLARAAGRERELAIRSALGAGWGRLVRQMVAESLVLAAIGGLAGIVLGTWAARALAVVQLPGDLPIKFDFQPDLRVAAYTALLAGGVGLLIGLASAVRVTRSDLNDLLRGSRTGPRGVHRLSIRGVLVVAQIASCFVILAVAGAFGRSLFEAERADLGFRPEGVLNVHMDVGQLGYSERQGRLFFDDVHRRVRMLPGVQTASFALTVPMGYIRVTREVEAEGQPSNSRSTLLAGTNIVSAEYFETMGIPIVRGRSFSDADDERSSRVAVVNRSFAARLWPGQDPIGRRFRTAASDGPWVEVVGVTNTGRYRSLFEDPQPYFYAPLAQEYTGLRVLQVRTVQPPDALAPTVARTVQALEPNLPLYDVQSMRRALGSGPGLFPVRAGAVSLAALGMLAFALAIVGLYGVVSYLTRERTHEIGVRVALGATPRDVVRLVLRQGSTLVAGGIVAGLLMALALSLAVDRFLFGVSAGDPLTLAGVAPILAGVAFVACVVPARRAARVDPAAALRSE